VASLSFSSGKASSFTKKALRRAAYLSEPVILGPCGAQGGAADSGGTVDRRRGMFLGLPLSDAYQTLTKRVEGVTTAGSQPDWGEEALKNSLPYMAPAREKVYS